MQNAQNKHFQQQLYELLDTIKTEKQGSIIFVSAKANIVLLKMLQIILSLQIWLTSEHQTAGKYKSQ